MITSPLCRHYNTDDDLQHRLADWRRASEVGLDKGQACENPTNYFETDTGRMGNEAGLYHMAPQKTTGGTVATC
jgi:hypothetical protein